MAEEFNETEKRVDEDCDVKDGKAVEKFGFIKHPIKTIRKSKEDHPVGWAVAGLVTIGAGLLGTYVLGRYSADRMAFEPEVVPNIPTDVPEIETSYNTLPVETADTVTEVVNQ